MFPSSAVHPKTGRVCVPIDPTNVREFDPFAVPTLGQLVRQIDQYDKDNGEEVMKYTALTVNIIADALKCRMSLEP